MTTVDTATAVRLLDRPMSSGTATMRRIVDGLARSLAAEGISDDLIDALDFVLGDRPRPETHCRGRGLDGLLLRLGLPLPQRHRRPAAATPISAEAAARITARFNRATIQLAQITPLRVAPHPTEELRRLLALRDERPAQDATLSYLRRYALAVVAVLDLLGDDA